MDSATRLEKHVRNVLFKGTEGPPRMGAEIEVIPVHAETRLRAPIHADPEAIPGGIASDPIVAVWAQRRGWVRVVTEYGAPAFLARHGGRLSFEPGGQIEYSSPPFERVDVLTDHLTEVVGSLVGVGRDHGIDFVARGIDPVGRLMDTHLQFDASRYSRMARHYDSIGPWGRRMMLQTAAIHINVDSGVNPVERFRVASLAAPSWTAIFANSPRAEGEATGFRSYRAEQWRKLDPTRTGLPWIGGPPVERYVDFARGAVAFLLGEDPEVSYSGDQRNSPFEKFECATVSQDEVEVHLSTLFPEVRPRGYLELRSFDALPLRWYAVPLVLVAGLLCDPRSVRDADELLKDVTPSDLDRAGKVGVTDPTVRDRALDIFDIALEGARRLESMGTGLGVEIAQDYRAGYLAMGRDPGHDLADST